MADETKTCPQCAETVKSAAKICRYCGHEFKEPGIWAKAGDAAANAVQGAFEEEREKAKSKSPEQLKADKSKQKVGCGIIALIVVAAMVWIIGSGVDSNVSDTHYAAEAAVDAEEMRKGFHCLSEWDGSNRSAVRQIEALLRDPNSFEHVETRIMPLDEATGEHGLWMTYRARNGFGGMNVEQIYARVNTASCEARLLPDGPGSN